MLCLGLKPGPQDSRRRRIHWAMAAAKKLDPIMGSNFGWDSHCLFFMSLNIEQGCAIHCFEGLLRQLLRLLSCS